MDKGHGKLTVICSDWKPLQRNTLQGFASVEVVEMGLVIRDVAIHQKNDRAWAAPPSVPWIKDDRVVRDDAGKIKYSIILEFPRKEVRDAFSAAVIHAVCERFPNALALEEAAS
jgi:hypothetical protein